MTAFSELVMSATYGLGATDAPARKMRLWYAPFVLLLALGTMSLATQRVAEYFSYHTALGTPLLTPFRWYLPWAVFGWQRQFLAQDPYGFMEQAVTESQALYLLPQFVIIAWLFFGKTLKGNASLHGSARWASEPEIRLMGYLDGKGVYVGGYARKLAGAALLWAYFAGRPLEQHLYLRHNGPEHLLVFAPTRSGKGVGLILPTLLAWEGSALVLDIKGENWALTAGFRRSMGQKTLRFDPSDSSGASACFNPLEEIRLDSLLAIPDAQNIASMLVDPEGKGLDDHWSKAGFAMLGGSLLHCCIMTLANEKRAATLYDLSCMLADENRTIEDLFNEMVAAPHAALLQEIFPQSDATEYGAKAHTFIASSAREMLNKAENEASGVISTVLVNLALYRDPVVALNTSRCDFRIHDLMNHDAPVNLYLVISPADIDRVRPLVRLMVDMIVRRTCAKMEFADGSSVKSYKHRLLLLLDEFTSLGKLPIMEKALAYIAGYGGKVYIIVQDITQLNGVYGRENALMANCHIRLAYAPNTVDTANTLSEMTGKTTVVDKKVSLSGSRSGHMKNASVSVNETARPLLTPDECMRLPGPVKDGQGRVVKPGDMLIFTAGKPPIYGRQILYFLDPVFSARSKIRAPGLTAEYPSGVSDSLHFTMPVVHQATATAPDVLPAPDSQTHEGGSYEYFQ